MAYDVSATAWAYCPPVNAGPVSRQVYPLSDFPGTWTAPGTPRPQRTGRADMTRMPTVTLTAPVRTDSRAVPHDEAPVDPIKDAVYWRDRQWDHEARCW